MMPTFNVSEVYGLCCTASSSAPPSSAKCSYTLVEACYYDVQQIENVDIVEEYVRHWIQSKM